MNEAKSSEMQRTAFEMIELHTKVKSLTTDRELMLGKITDLESRNTFY